MAEARRLDDMRQNFKQFGLDSQTMTAIADLLQTLALAACLLLIAWILSGLADAPFRGFEFLPLALSFLPPCCCSHLPWRRQN